MVLETILKWGIYFLIIILSAIPLWVSLRVMGSRPGIIKILLVNFDLAILGAAITYFLGSIGYFTILINFVVYMFAFRLGPIRTLIALLISVVISVIFVVGTLLAFGIGLAILL